MPEGRSLDADWLGDDSPIGDCIRAESWRMLDAYRSQPNLIREQANQEQDAARGGYAHRQIVELVQNGADQLSQTPGGRIDIRLTRDCLYCADAGAPITEDGARALLFSHLSPKRETLEIGRFGIGFKSVLGVSDRPEFFSRSGSFRFDRERAAKRIREVVPDAERLEHFPVLRVAEPVDPREAARADPRLRDMMQWATNIVRLPLKSGAHDDVAEQMAEFRTEFLLMAEHVEKLDLCSDDGAMARSLQLTRTGEQFVLHDGEDASRWMVFSRIHALSDAARHDARTLDNPERVELKWAAPLEPESGIQHFWAFFPTLTSSLLAGILNAPWKTNEDRQNLLPGSYNAELIDAAAELVADSIRSLSATAQNPVRHLDVLPRRAEPGDNDHANRLRSQLYQYLQQRECVPDQNGTLQRHEKIHYPPEKFIEGRRLVAVDSLKIWSDYEHRPSDWLHHDAITADRLAAIDRIFGYRGSSWYPRASRASRASITEWLEALVQAGKENDDAAHASMAAIATDAALPEGVRVGESLGCIVLTADGGWSKPAPDALFLSDGIGGDPSTTVHPDLEADPDARKALEALGVKPPSPESRLRSLAAALTQVDAHSARLDPILSLPDEVKELLTLMTLKGDSAWFDPISAQLWKSIAQGRKVVREARTNPRWEQFWECSREVERETARKLIDSGFTGGPVCVKTLAGSWEPLNEVLLPGPIVPEDGRRDDGIAIDVRFHGADLPLLEALGISDSPYDRYKPSEKYLGYYLYKCRSRFQRDRKISTGSTPQGRSLDFIEKMTSGPLEVFGHLSEEGAVQFTETLLNLDSTFDRWTMQHESWRQQAKYPSIQYPSPAVEALCVHGRVSVNGAIHPLAAGLGDDPENPAVQRWLLEHPNSYRIRKAFPDLHTDFSDEAEPIGDEEPVPLLDVWPGLADALAGGENLSLVRCDRIVDARGEDVPADCVKKDGEIYLLRKDDERAELEAIVRDLDLDIDNPKLDAILRRETSQDVQRARRRVRNQPTDAARLLEAVGEDRLRARLPQTLIDILSHQGPFTGERVAEAAIATFHTGALREYRHAISHLTPPQQWAGSQTALAFVQSLDFSPEWAGQPTPKRAGVVDVPGPRSLPELHNYQRSVVDNVKKLLSGASEENRGLVSMPTGSGKTRVAVQAVIEAMRDHQLHGVVLWVADRDELCEQAVQSWRQAWASIGPEAQPLRISRWWGGQRQPETIDGSHVVVATIQTLQARIAQSRSRAVLNGVRLLVVDEAHGSIAPSYTQLMGKLGLTFRRQEAEPFLLGLTATPYRGRDEEETARLVNRYGRNRLDAGAFRSDAPEAVIAELQEMTVLARADHEVIEGERFSLDASERREIEEKNLPWLPESVERRIAASAKRTQAIVDAYREHVAGATDPDAPTLIFATSVDHAKTIAAMLQLDGVTARAVSSETEPAVRRSTVEQFRAGAVKVLVNYGVFREGFDAPKTRAIIVARPVYSPNLYFQMIGRGLRGELNGGSDRCLVLDVEDNIENYDRALAFSESDWLWV